MKVGIVGCGVISANYAKGARGFDSYEIVACADLDRAMAETLAAEHGYEVAAVDELLADPAIDVVLNLTPPGAHAAVLRDALAAGKHVYTEKPLTAVVEEAPEILDEADRRGLRIGCAPDIFLGSAYQAARALIDEGAIGQPISASATCLVGGPVALAPEPGHLLPRRRRPAARHGAVLPHVDRGAARSRQGGDGHRDDARGRAADRDRAAQGGDLRELHADPHGRRARARDGRRARR